jgi:hypothetical protein
MRSIVSLLFLISVASCGASRQAKIVDFGVGGSTGTGGSSKASGGESGAAGSAASGGAAGSQSGGAGGSKSGTGGTASSGGASGGVSGGDGGKASSGGSSGQGGSVSQGGSTTVGTGGSGGSTGTSTGTPQCKDGLLDQDETDVDCGGRVCPARCPAGKSCLADSDCDRSKSPVNCSRSTFKCVDGCTDGSKDGDETGIDCGGSCPQKCVGEPCTANDGCQSLNCDTTAGKCLAPEHPLIVIKQTCWDGIPNFNDSDKVVAKTKIVPCMITNKCCAANVSTCTDACFTNVDAVCGMNKFSGGAQPHDFIAKYYQSCVP